MIIYRPMALFHLFKTLTGRKISLYADFIDPFCYIAFHTLRPLAESRGIELDWRGFEFNPATPPEGLPLVTAENSDLRPGMWASVQNLARRAGLDFPEPQRVPNTRLAQILVATVPVPAVTNPLIERLYQAYFRGRQDIGQSEILIDLATAFKIPQERLRAAWSDPRQTQRLEAHRTEAQSRRFMGLPGFVYRGKNYFGALSEQAWKEILR